MSFGITLFGLYVIIKKTQNDFRDKKKLKYQISLNNTKNSNTMKYLFWFIVLICIANSLTVYASPLSEGKKKTRTKLNIFLLSFYCLIIMHLTFSLVVKSSHFVKRCSLDSCGNDDDCCKGLICIVGYCNLF